VRIPSWVDREKLQISGVAIQPIWTDNKLYFPQLQDGCALEIKFKLSERIIMMARNHIRPIQVKLKGDSVLAMDNFGADFTFFDSIE